MHIIHFCGYGCQLCGGTGEGRTDRTECKVCDGNGFCGQGEIEVDVDETDLGSPRICPECEKDLREELTFDV